MSAPLPEFEVTITLVDTESPDKPTRTWMVTVPATSFANARSAGFLIGQGINAGSQHRWKFIGDGVAVRPVDAEARQTECPIAPDGCDDCSVEPGEQHRWASCPSAERQRIRKAQSAGAR